MRALGKQAPTEFGTPAPRGRISLAKALPTHPNRFAANRLGLWTTSGHWEAAGDEVHVLSLRISRKLSSARIQNAPPLRRGDTGGFFVQSQRPGDGLNHAIQVVINLDLANTIQNPPVSPLRKGGEIHNLSVVRGLRLIQRSFRGIGSQLQSLNLTMVVSSCDGLGFLPWLWPSRRPGPSLAGASSRSRSSAVLRLYFIYGQSPFFPLPPRNTRQFQYSRFSGLAHPPALHCSMPRLVHS